MKNSRLLILTIYVLILAGCVQPSGTKTIIVKLNVEGIEKIQSVGIRGSDAPLSWDYDMELAPIIQDSLYVATFSLVTGYTFTEAKFTVNGQFELNDQDNRRIVFSDSDTTIFEAKFDVVDK